MDCGQSQQQPGAEAENTAANASQVTAVNMMTGFVFEGFNDTMEGTKVDENHENFITAYNMLTGIRFAVSRINAKVDRPLTSADFEKTVLYNFDTASPKHLFQFKDYMPWVFRHLRDVFGLDPVDYLMNLTAKYIVNILGSPGKSGSFFYYSKDYRFIIKTIHHSEHKRLRQILREYYKHVRKYPNTLLSQFYGLHRVKLPLGRKIHFVVMNNVFPALYEVHERFDLKGSTWGRSTDPKKSHKSIVYKDLDWLRQRKRIVLGPERAEALKEQLRIDVQMLRRINVMDYSFLIGIHDQSKGNRAIEVLKQHCVEFGPADAEHMRINSAINYGNISRRERDEFTELQKLLTNASPQKLREFDFSDERRAPKNQFYRDHGGYQSTGVNNEPLDVIYYIGIIDFLTEYNFRKHTETFFKSLVHDKIELSAIPAGEYGERFINFVCSSIGAIPSDSAAAKKATTSNQMSGEEKKRLTARPSLSALQTPRTPSKGTLRHVRSENMRTPSPSSPSTDLATNDSSTPSSHENEDPDSESCTTADESLHETAHKSADPVVAGPLEGPDDSSTVTVVN